MLSLNSAKAGSRLSSGKVVDEWPLLAVEDEGVVVEARREVRDGGRRGVVGREGGWRCVREVLRWHGGSDTGVVDAIVVWVVSAVE